MTFLARSLPAIATPAASCIGVLILIAACSAASAEDVVSGTAFYRERIALPPGAVLEVTLEDVSLADAPSHELPRVTVENPGNPPFNFAIPFDPAEIDARHTYAVRAAIRVDGELWFTTDTSYPVLTRGAGHEVELRLTRVARETASPQATLPNDFPASYEGELPCADCPGIHYRLDLFEDRTFFLRMTYLGRGAGAIDDVIGTWAVAADDNRLTLFGGRETPIFFRVVDRDTLRKLDIEGRDIQSSLDYELRRKDGLDLLEPRLEMRGMYRYMADAALFEECLSGRSFPVAFEADNRSLERAYLDAPHEPGAPVLVSLQGRLALRPSMEGDALQITLIPERFIGIWPRETCGTKMATAELLDTYWKLTRLGDEPVLMGEMAREPHLVLHSQDQRVSGFSGCNRLVGGFELEGDAIEFSQMASTMMACVEGADTERAFIEALGTARSWRIIGQHLDLFDENGDLVARFEATYFD
jgi:uncharacterized lipoprotein YbaY/heat shock protein HslJ/uncharacterized lipoprotein NlpE involved in copper resistance